MNIDINLGDLDVWQLSAAVDLMTKRDASFEAHLLASFKRFQESGSALVLKYVDKFFPNTRWEEFEAEMLSSPDRCLCFEELFKYVKPRFGGLRWPELEKRLVEWKVKDHLILQYRNMIDWSDPRCDFEIPSILCTRKVFKVSRERKWEKQTTVVEKCFMYVEADDAEEAENIADSFDEDGDEWETNEDSREEYSTDGYDFEFSPLEAELIEDPATLPVHHTIYNAGNMPPGRG